LACGWRWARRADGAADGLEGSVEIAGLGLLLGVMATVLYDAVRVAMLHGVSAYDPLTLAVVAGTL